MTYLIAILLAMLLTGCAADTPAPPVPQDTTGITSDASPGTYLPHSAIELQTKGAIRAYAPSISNCVAVYPMGDDLLLLSGTETTTLTVLKGAQLVPDAQRTLPCLLQTGSGAIQVCADGIVYYDSKQNAVVFLDPELLQTRLVSLPDNIQGIPAISADWSEVYYCSPKTVNALDLSTGLTRLVKQHITADQTLTGIYFDDTVLSCDMTLPNGEVHCIYLSAKNGQALHHGKELEWFHSSGNNYLTGFTDGTAYLCLAGTRGKAPKSVLTPPQTQAYPVAEGNAAILMDVHTGGTTLSHLDLNTGKKTVSVELGDNAQIRYLLTVEDRVWMIAENQIWCWDPTKGSTPDNGTYCQPYYTAQSPDWEGLAQCQKQANALGDTYGLRILIGRNTLRNPPDDCTFVPEHLVSVCQRDLDRLEAILEKLPQGFLKAAAAGSKNGTLTLSLVRSLHCNDQTEHPENTPGIEYWMDGSVYIALVMGDSLEASLYHELSHLIDNRVLCTTKVYDDWTGLNPAGFAYDYSYPLNLLRTDDTYLNGDDRAFIDTYSMSYPREDRARILEYAMTPGNAALFTSPFLQAKLEVICLGIREAFDLDGSETYLWEQYLQEETVP